MKKITDDFLYRSFLVDLLTIKGVSILKGRRVTCQKIKWVEKEYKNLYGTDPKTDFISVKDKYLIEENSFENLYKTRHKKTPKTKTTGGISTAKTFNYNCSDWIKKRKEVLKRDNFTCRGCESKNDLQCHHSYYINGRRLWEYPLQSFLTLCRCCHEEFHEKIKGSELVIRTKEAIAQKINEEKLLGFVLVRPKKVVEKPKVLNKPKKNNKTKPLPKTKNERRVIGLWHGLSKEEKALSKRYEKLKTQ